MSACTVCGWREAKTKGRCGTCDTYARRNHRPRPPELITKHVERVVNREARR
jgi:predicted ATP-dependent serine protease